MAKKYFNDIFIGIIIALVSIPISMGYAGVAGLPAVYGLYGSLLPILIYGLMSSSKGFVFGVDAAPAVLAGGILASCGILAESDQALKILPVISLVVAIWLFIFYLLKADRLLKFISSSVMGGFITGIGVTIILMQIPKLFGGTSGTGEILELLIHIYKEASSGFHLLSFAIGCGTFLLILVIKKIAPKIPMQVIMMFLGAGLTYFLHLDKYGVKTLPAVERGLPLFILPDVFLLHTHFYDIILPSFTIALVILAETLLSSSNLALKNDYKLKSRREILTYSICNLSAALSGTCPVNGSVSRSGIADQFGVKSQIMSISAAATMCIILLFGTGFIAYLPVPVLTGIVISALWGTFEFELAHSLKKTDRTEFFIFYGAFFAVLFLGTIYGVLIGLVLSSVTFIIRQSSPKTEFVGYDKEAKEFRAMNGTNPNLCPLQDTVIFRFSGPLFYANINVFADTLDTKITNDTKNILIDAGGITSIDVTAAERLLIMYKKFEKKGISFALTSHVSNLNSQLIEYGAGELVYHRKVFSHKKDALLSMGLSEPYNLLQTEESDKPAKKYTKTLAEFEWAYGTKADIIMQNAVNAAANEIAQKGILDFDSIESEDLLKAKNYWSDSEKDEFLDMLTIQIESLQEENPKNLKPARARELEAKINLLHAELEEKLFTKNNDSIRNIVRHRLERDKKIKLTHPEIYSKLELDRELYFEEIVMTNPELAKKIADLICEEEKKM